MMHTALRLVGAILILSAVSPEARGCSCPTIRLPEFHASSEVVLAVEVRSPVESLSQDGESLLVWPIRTAETFKGTLSADRLWMPASAICLGRLLPGKRYLVFSDPSGQVGSCNYKELRGNVELHPDVDVLRALVAQKIPAATEPWVFHRSGDSCSLSHRLDKGSSTIRFVYRLVDATELTNTQYSYPTGTPAQTRFEGSAPHPASFSGFFELRLWYHESRFVVEGSGTLQVGDKSWKTRRESLERPLVSGYEVLDEFQAKEVLETLANGVRIATAATVEHLPSGRIGRHPEYPTVTAETPRAYLSDNLERFKTCLEVGN